MSHVDDGTLHAWLDGAFTSDADRSREIEAHLAACEECRARLEHERAVRDRATRVLQQMAPDAVRVEPFEHIVAARRAARSTPADTPVSGGAAANDAAAANERHRPGRRFFMPLSLAATALLAVTAAWFAQAYLPRSSGDAALEKEAVAETSATAPADARQEARLAPPAQTELQQSASNRVQPPPAEADRTATPPAARSAAGAGSEEKAVAAAPPPVLARGNEAAERRAADSLLGRAALALDELVVTGIAVSPEPVPPDSLVRTRLQLVAAADWTVTTEPEAARVLGRAPARIENLAVDSVWTASVDSLLFVRVMQQVAPAAVVEILEWTRLPASRDDQRAREATGVRPNPLAARAEAGFRTLHDEAARAMLRVLLPERNVVIRGALPADSLAALARRVR